MIAEPVRTYLIHALEAAPLAISRLLSGEVAWDARPNPERFTLREMSAHLADWEPIWMERVARIANENNPFLPSVDEGKLCAERDYAALEPGESLARYQSGREELVAAIQMLPPEAWSRKAHREFVGDIDFVQLVGMIVGHDGYHLKQAMGFRM